MIEKEILRDGEKIIQVRSEGGKLLYVKTRSGYEMKCPRTKKICLIRYEDMLADCLSCLNDSAENPGFKTFQQLLEKRVKTGTAPVC